jgi:hypothetical protein
MFPYKDILMQMSGDNIECGGCFITRRLVSKFKYQKGARFIIAVVSNISYSTYLILNPAKTVNQNLFLPCHILHHD